MMISSLCIGVIESSIKDAFPKSKVIVFCEESTFYPTMIAVKAYVDEYGACITLDVFKGFTEEYISRELISMIKDQKEKKD